MRDAVFVKNMGVGDRGIRAIIGLAGIATWFLGWISGVWAPILGIVGIVLLLTAVVGFCPIYRLLGIRTMTGTSAV